MLRHDLTNGRHLMPVGQLEQPQSRSRTRTSSTCGGGGGALNRVSISSNELNQKLLWRAEALSPMTDARKRLFRKLAITLLLVNIERLEELDRMADGGDDDGADRPHHRPHPEKLSAPVLIRALESYSIRNAKPSQHSPAEHRSTPIEPSPVVDDVLEAVGHEEIWHRKPKKTLSWRIKPSDTIRHNNSTKPVAPDRRKPKRQSFAIDQLDGNFIARVTTV